MFPGIGKMSIDPLQRVAETKNAAGSRDKGRGAGSAPGTASAEDVFSRGAEKAERPSYAKKAVETPSSGSRLFVLRDLVARTFAKQGMATAIDVGGGRTADILQLSPEEAKELTAGDGYWGVEQTADRIAQFAISTAGNDPAKLDKIKEGINKGFRMAQQAFAMALPEISSKTYDAVMKKLDAWAETAGKAGAAAG